MNLDFNALLTIAQDAGFSGHDAVVAAAIALAESSGNPSCVGDLSITPGGSIGLWQINVRWHPEVDASRLTDPQYNCQCAFKIYQARGFSPWSTYKSGAYIEYLPTTEVA